MHKDNSVNHATAHACACASMQAAKPIQKGSDLDELLVADEFIVVRWFSGKALDDDPEYAR